MHNQEPLFSSSNNHFLLSQFPQKQEDSNFIDTQRHFKIWLSSNPDRFINPENELRLVRFLDRNPEPAQLTLIYSSKLLGSKGHQELERFKLQYPSVILIDFDTDLKDQCLSERDQKLYEFARQEIVYSREESIDNTFERDLASIGGGNLAAASDLIRTLTPAAEMGTYSDFDTDIKTKGLDRYISIPMAWIGNASQLSEPITFVDPRNHEFKSIDFSINNDIQAYGVDYQGKLSQEAKVLLEKIQDAMILAYETPLYHIISQRLSGMLKMTLQTGSVFYAHPLISVIQLRKMLGEINSMYMFAKIVIPFALKNQIPQEQLATIMPAMASLPLETLQKIEREFSDLTRRDFSEDFKPEEKENIFRIIIEIQALSKPTLLAKLEGLKEQSKTLTGGSLKHQQTLIQSAEYMINKIDAIEAYALEGQIEKAISLLLSQEMPPEMEDCNQNFLWKKESVCCFSGPVTLQDCLTDIMREYTQSPVSWDVMKSFGFSENPLLQQAYRSTNGSGLKKPMNPFQVGELCDLSWTAEGQMRQKAREDSYGKAAQKIKNIIKKKIAK